MDTKSSKAGFSSEKLALIPPMLQSVVDAGDLSGFVTLIFHKGEVAQVNTIGHRDIATKAPMTRDTLFRIASMTKPVTSTAALMLMEEGKLKLEDPITKWLPEFAEMHVLKKADGPLDDTYPSPRDITVEDLFTHRSGLSYAFSAIGPIAKAYDKALGDVLNNNPSPDAWLKALAALPLLYPPGERFHYSYDRCARLSRRPDRKEAVPRRADGAPLRTARDARHRLLRSEGKARAARPRSTVRTTATGVLNVAAFHQHDAPPEFCGGGGGLISTADDYLKFARMLMSKGEFEGVRHI